MRKPTDFKYKVLRGSQKDVDSVNITIYQEGEKFANGHYNIRTNIVHIDLEDVNGNDVDAHLYDYLTWAIEERKIELN